MITIHRDYCLYNNSDLHAHIKVNPTGKLEVEIVELRECLTTDFDDLSFESCGCQTRICGLEQTTPWQVELKSSDALELSHLVEEANEEYETLMNDLM